MGQISFPERINLEVWLTIQRLSLYSSINILVIQQIFPKLRTSMLRSNPCMEQRRLSITIKSNAKITSSTTSINSLPHNPNALLPSHHQILLTPSQGPSQPFKIRLNLSNLPLQPAPHLPLTSPQTELSCVNLKRIVDSVMELKRALLLYRYLEHDEEKCKKVVFSWFKETETAFLQCLNCPANPAAAQALLQQEQKNRSKGLTPPGQENIPVHFTYSSKSINEALPNEVADLKEEVQAYRRDAIEALQKLQSVLKIAAGLRTKHEAYQKQREVQQGEKKLLQAAVREYVQQGDEILKKINGKQAKEGTVSQLQQETRQMLIKLKFKAFEALTI